MPTLFVFHPLSDVRNRQLVVPIILVRWYNVQTIETMGKVNQSMGDQKDNLPMAGKSVSPELTTQSIGSTQ